MPFLSALSPRFVAKDIGIVAHKPNPKRPFKGSDSLQALSFTPCNVAICLSFATIEVKPKDAARANGKVLQLFALMSMSVCERRMSTTASCFPLMAKIRPLCGQFSFLKLTSTSRTMAALTFATFPFLQALKKSSLRLAHSLLRP